MFRSQITTKSKLNFTGSATSFIRIFALPFRLGESTTCTKAVTIVNVLSFSLQNSQSDLIFYPKGFTSLHDISAQFPLRVSHQQELHIILHQQRENPSISIVD